MIEIRQLGPADADLARAATKRFKGGTGELETWLASSRQMMLVALEGRSPVGWVYGYELPRVDREQSMWLLYEIDVSESYRRQGIGSKLLAEFRSRAAGPVWLLTNRSNAPAMRLYADGEFPNEDDVLVRFP
ncbi:MAG: GNAT family N-acetyltransferase [Planctomycetota bacterium]